MQTIQTPQMTHGVKWILIINTAIFILQQIPITGFVDQYGMFHAGVILSGEIWRLITFNFLHGSLFHILFNMLGLWFFGPELERMWGTKKFLQLYMIFGLCCGLFSLFSIFNSPVPSIVGASGIILALLTIYALYYPDREILIFFVFPMKILYAVMLFTVISVVFTLFGSNDNTAHITHLGGIIFGYLYFKSKDSLENYFANRQQKKVEQKMRTTVEKKLKRDQYFEQVIDPILKKISEHGMESLTDKEKAQLKSVKKSKDNIIKGNFGNND